MSTIVALATLIVAASFPSLALATCSLSSLNSLTNNDPYFVIIPDSTPFTVTFVAISTVINSSVNLPEGLYNAECINTNDNPVIPYNIGTIRCVGGRWAGTKGNWIDATAMSCARIGMPTTLSPTSPCLLSTLNSMAEQDLYLTIGMNTGSFHSGNFILVAGNTAHELASTFTPGIYHTQCIDIGNLPLIGVYNQGTITCSGGIWSGNTTVLSCGDGTPMTTPTTSTSTATTPIPSSCSIAALNSIANNSALQINKTPGRSTGGYFVWVQEEARLRPSENVPNGLYTTMCHKLSTSNSDDTVGAYNVGTVSCSGGRWWPVTVTGSNTPFAC